MNSSPARQEKLESPVEQKLESPVEQKLRSIDEILEDCFHKSLALKDRLKFCLRPSIPKEAENMKKSLDENIDSDLVIRLNKIACNIKGVMDILDGINSDSQV